MNIIFNAVLVIFCDITKFNNKWLAIFTYCNSMLVCYICSISKFPKTIDILKLTFDYSNAIFDISCIRKLQCIFYCSILKTFLSTVDWNGIWKSLLIFTTYPSCFRKQHRISISNTGEVNFSNYLCFPINRYLDRDFSFFRMFLEIYSSIDIKRTFGIRVFFNIISIG